MGWQLPFILGGHADLPQPSLTLSPELQAPSAGEGPWPSLLRYPLPAALPSPAPGYLLLLWGSLCLSVGGYGA